MIRRLTLVLLLQTNLGIEEGQILNLLGNVHNFTVVLDVKSKRHGIKIEFLFYFVVMFLTHENEIGAINCGWVVHRTDKLQPMFHL